MRHQIRTLQVPRVGLGAFACLPAMSSTASFNGQNEVIGAPGTVPVYSPRPAALSDGQLGGPHNQPSDVAPNYILPCVYVAKVSRSMQFPSDSYSATPGPYLGPVPSTGIGAVPALGFANPVIGGRRVTRALRPFTKWLTWGSGKAAEG